MAEVLVSGAFDDLGSRQIRLLQEAARQGPVRVLLWSDAAVQRRTGTPPRFGAEERRYMTSALRYVADVQVTDRPEDVPADSLFDVQDESRMAGFPDDARAEAAVPRTQRPPRGGAAQQTVRPRAADGRPARRVVVTGCFDWLHSGHVRFFEEAAGLGELYVVVGSDANVRLLKGEGHPRFPQEERRYVAQAVRFVHAALVSTGTGWMDAEPEIRLIGAHAYVVNEDGDKPEKRAFCGAHGLEYVVLKREPAPGLPRRTSTALRGF